MIAYPNSICALTTSNAFRLSATGPGVWPYLVASIIAILASIIVADIALLYYIYGIETKYCGSHYQL